MKAAARLLDCGDSAVTVEVGDAISAQAAAQVAALDAAITAAATEGRLPGVLEVVPTFRSVTVIYDPLVTARAALDPLLLALAAAGGTARTAAPRRWRLPVCYEGDFAPDLHAVAEALSLPASAVVEQHAGAELAVYMIGFMPGFPFLGELPPALDVPRLTEPRVRVPAGSVAITGRLSAIYPSQSPGGWRILGRCPVRLFDAGAALPSLLAPGDRVRFEPVSSQRYAELHAHPPQPAAWQA